MQIIDLYGITMTVTDLKAAIDQQELMVELQMEGDAYVLRNLERRAYHAHLLQQLLRLRDSPPSPSDSCKIFTVILKL